MSKFKNIPPQIAAKLQSSLGRVRRILFFRGVCATLAVFVASVLAIMAVDAMVTIYVSWVRWLLSSFGGVATVIAAWCSLINPLRRKFTAAEIASLIERNHPELEERLSTVVELSAAGDLDVSSTLMDEITKDAIKDAAAVLPRKEFTGRTVKPRLIAAAIALGIFAVLFAAFPNATLRLATRALVPSAEVDNIYASSLKVSPGDKVLLEGSSLTVNLAVDGGFPSRAFVRTRIDGKREAVERMIRVNEEDAPGPAFYSFNYPQVTESFTYRMNCGSALTRGYRVTVVPEPRYVDRQIEIVYPAYTGRIPDVYTNSAEIVALAGSKVTVSAKTARPGIEGELRFAGGKTVVGSVDEKGGIEFLFDIDKDSVGSWSAVLWDSYGFTNVVEESSVTIVKDSPPEIKLLSPEKSDFRLPRIGSLPIVFAVKDDFGVKRSVVEVCIGAGTWVDAVDADLFKTDESTYSGSYTMRFLSDEYKDVNVMRCRIRAEDNLPAEAGGPGIAYSPEITVEIFDNDLNDEEQSLDSQDLAEQVEKKKRELNTIVDELRHAKKFFDSATGGYRQAERNEWHRRESIKNTDNAKSHITNAEGLLIELIDALLSDRLAPGAEIFKPVLNDHIVPIRQGAHDIYLISVFADKATAARKLAKDTEETIKLFEDAQRKFDLLAKAAEELQRLQDLTERQEALAELAEQEKIDAETLLEEEKKLLEELKEEIKDELELNLDKQIEETKKLEEHAESLKKRQEEIEKKSAKAANNKDEAALKEAAREEQILARDIEAFSRKTKKQAEKIENEVGAVEADNNKTAEPLEKASEITDNASEEAKAAAEKLNKKDYESAKEDMQSVKDALSQAEKQLSAARKKMEEKNKELTKNAEELNEMVKSLEKAIEKAAAAAEEKKQQEEQQGEKKEGQHSQKMQQAAEQAQQAAQKMKDQAKEQAKQANMPRSNPQKSKKSNTNKGGNKPKKKGSNFDENWFKMKSESGTGAEVDALDDVPAEYRALVRDYFKALNEGGKK